MKKGRKVTRLGTGIRIPLEDIVDYRLLAHGLNKIALSRLFHGLVIEAGLGLSLSKTPVLHEGGLISSIQRAEELVSACRRIVKRGTRSLGNSQAQSIWIPLEDAERKSLGEIANLLSWSEGKMIAECLHDAVVLGGATLPLTQAPVVAALYRAVRLSSKRTEAELLSKINPVLEKAGRDRQRKDERSSYTERSESLSSVVSFSVGRTREGEAITFDLAKADSLHGLVVGETGSGKSELLRSIASDLISKNTPSSLRLVLIDPKAQTFVGAERSPFLHGPVIASAEDVLSHLKTLGSSVTAPSKSPAWAIIIDDLDALLHSAGSLRQPLIELLIQIAQKGAKRNVHILAAVQDFDLISESLKSNFRSNICLRVKSESVSKEVLGESGAEALSGKGDLLCNVGGEIRRAQSYFIGQNQLQRLFQTMPNA